MIGRNQELPDVSLLDREVTSSTQRRNVLRIYSQRLFVRKIGVLFSTEFPITKRHVIVTNICQCTRFVICEKNLQSTLIVLQVHAEISNEVSKVFCCALIKRPRDQPVELALQGFGPLFPVLSQIGFEHVTKV